MRGSRRIGLLAISVVCVFAFTATSAFADQLFTKEPALGGVALRDIKDLPENQPSAIELVSDGNTELKVGAKLSVCTEAEFGAFVVSNKGLTDPAGDPVLAVPFGVFENCTVEAKNSPVYLDTEGNPKAHSGIVAVINDDGVPNPNNVVLTGLKLSLLLEAGVTCTFETPAAGIVGAWVNEKGPFKEEEAEKQTFVDFKGQKLNTSAACGTTAEIVKAKLFVETMSDSPNFTGSSDTVWFE